MKKAIDWFIYFIFSFFPIISILYITDVLAMHYIVGFIPFISTMLIVILFLIKKFKSSIKDNSIMLLLILSVVSVPLSSILCAVKPYRFHTERVENGIEITGYSVNWINDYKKEFLIELPSTIRNKEVISIGEDAFNGCPYFDELVIPEGVKVIKEDAFFFVHSRTVKLPQTLEKIEDQGLYQCCKKELLDYIILPKNLNYVGYHGCGDVAKIIFVPKSLQTVIYEEKWHIIWYAGMANTDVYYDVKDVVIKDEYYVITYNDGTTENINKK